MKRLNDYRMKVLFVGFIAVVAIFGVCTKGDMVMDAIPAEDMPGSGKGVSFSHDGLRLYITTSSNILPGGYGSRDIWVVERYQ